MKQRFIDLKNMFELIGTILLALIFIIVPIMFIVMIIKLAWGLI